MRPSPCGACCGGICGKAHHCGTMQASSPTNHVQRSQHTARQNSSAVAFTPILYKGKYAFQHAEKKSDLYFPVNRALHFYVMLRQHRTIPALRLKHRSGSCGTASALPKCSIMSGCGTRIVLRGQKPSHSATAAPASVRCFRHWRRSPLQHPVLSALLAWHLPHLARRIGT